MSYLWGAPLFSLCNLSNIRIWKFGWKSKFFRYSDHAHVKCWQYGQNQNFQFKFKFVQVQDQLYFHLKNKKKNKNKNKNKKKTCCKIHFDKNKQTKSYGRVDWKANELDNSLPLVTQTTYINKKVGSTYVDSLASLISFGSLSLPLYLL